MGATRDSLVAAWITGLAFSASLTAAPQQDLRDVITLKSGKEERGRVANPFDAGPMILLQGSKRVRINRDDIAQQDTVAQRIDEFFQRRQKLHDKPAAQAMLFDWAKSHGLDRLAELHAMASCLTSDDSFGHERLGHQNKGGIWLWPHEGKHLRIEQLESAMSSKTLQLHGERFTVFLDGYLKNGVNALLDLERMAAHMMSEFGEGLGMLDAQRPVLVDIRSQSDKFQKWGFRPLPWFDPPPHGDIGRTLYAQPMQARPQRLFFTGAHGLLYRSLIGETGARDSRDRVCSWLEVGLAMQMELAMQGDAGWAEPKPATDLAQWAAQTPQADADLTQLMRQSMFGGFYLMDDGATRANWTLATMFTQWMLRADNVPATRSRFLSYAKLTLGNKRGESSSAWSGAMGKPVEEFGDPFHSWLASLRSR